MEERRRAAVVAIGDELLEGRYPDTNSGRISAGLAELGIETECFVVLGDDRRRLERVLYDLCSEFQIVIASGGLGPTLDDVTREAAAAAAGVPLLRDEATLSKLQELYRGRDLPFPSSNERQALFPQGAQIMPNPLGTAPGFRVWIDGGMLAVLPGPPHEMAGMLEHELLPWIERTCGSHEAVEKRTLCLAGLSESVFADRVGDWMARDANPRMGVTAHRGVLRVSLLGRAATRERARALVDERAAGLRERFEVELFSEQDPRLAFALGRRLIDEGLTLATAESCTGGLLAQLLTEVPGISAVYLEGWVTYSNLAKVRRLEVDPDLIERHGAVSSEVAGAMAVGAARQSGARLALSITGVAGPGGGTEAKPVGLVCFGLSVDGQVQAFERRFPDVGRESIRAFAAHTALDLLRRHLPAAGPTDSAGGKVADAAGRASDSH